MNNAKIADLNTQLKALNDEYRVIATEWTYYNDLYKSKMSDKGDEIRRVRDEIKRLKTPVED